MRCRHKLFRVLAAGLLVTGIGSAVIAPADRGVIRTEQTDFGTMRRDVDRMRRRMKNPDRRRAREMVRRLRQIAAGVLTTGNGLMPGAGR